MALAATAALVALTTACGGAPESFAVPEQRPQFPITRPHRAGSSVSMADGDADAHIVRDVLNGAPGWRWTGQDPAVKVNARAAIGMFYFADLSVAEATFKETGPIGLTFLVNGMEIGSARYDAPGQYHFEQAVRDGVLEPGKEAILGIHTDKVWESPVDHARLGIILTKIGLRQQ